MNARLNASGPGDRAPGPVVQYLSGIGAHLAHRELDPLGLPAGGHALGVEAVAVPGQVNAGSVLMAPAATAANRRLAPTGGPEDQSAEMLRGVSVMVQRESSEATLAYDAGHAVHTGITHFLRESRRQPYGWQRS